MFMFVSMYSFVYSNDDRYTHASALNGKIHSYAWPRFDAVAVTLALLGSRRCEHRPPELDRAQSVRPPADQRNRPELSGWRAGERSGGRNDEPAATGT